MNTEKTMHKIKRLEINYKSIIINVSYSTPKMEIYEKDSYSCQIHLGAVNGMNM
jgi:hypothetical protein